MICWLIEGRKYGGGKGDVKYVCNMHAGSRHKCRNRLGVRVAYRSNSSEHPLYTDSVIIQQPRASGDTDPKETVHKL